MNLTEGQLPQALETGRVSADYFPLFGAGVVMGRTFSNPDHQAGAARVVVIGENLWRGRFRGNPALGGNTISLNHEPCQVIGVLASGFAADRTIDGLPLQAYLSLAGHMNRVRVAARLRPGMTVENQLSNMLGTKKKTAVAQLSATAETEEETRNACDFTYPCQFPASAPDRAAAFRISCREPA
ncbi:MAG TPA: ABC transporter permease [Candidatus Acidoferrales bacterium]|nr:ABC transporter permease [Candidatus Acidoferrales bacterium]